jgi:hypothetical protein
VRVEPWDLHRPMVLAGRVLLWATLVMLLMAGLRSIVRPRVPLSGPRTGQGASFPTDAAKAYAARFVQAYLTYDQSSPGTRASALAAFLAPGEAVPAWDGAGKETVANVVPAGLDVRSADVAVVSVAAEVDAGWVYLAVPVRVSGPAMVVTAPPTFVAPPATAPLPAQAPVSNPDTGLALSLMPTLKAFFTAYAAGDGTQLSYFEAPGSHLQGLGGAVTLSSVVNAVAAPGGTSRQLSATVVWRAASGAGLMQTYDLGIEQVNGRWYVASVAPAVAAGS